MINRVRLACALLLAALAAPVWAGEFSFSADTMTGSMVKGRERVVLTGRATVLSDGMRINADRIELYGDDFRFAEAIGKVRVEDRNRGLLLTTDNLFYDRQDRIARLTGPSIMEDRTNSVVIKGNFIENDDKKEIALVQIDVRILREGLSCRAEFARYDRKGNTLELSGSPVVRRNGDEFRATLIRVNLDTDNILLLGSVSGVVSTTGMAETAGSTGSAASPDGSVVPGAGND